MKTRLSVLTCLVTAALVTGCGKRPSGVVAETTAAETANVAADTIAVATANMVDNGAFDRPLGSTWQLNVVPSSGAEAKVDLDAGAAHVTVTNAGQSVNWHIEFAQYKRHLEVGKWYDLSFRARASASRPISVSTQKDAPDWQNYGLSETVSLDTVWIRYVATFQANATVDDARLQFWLGAVPGEVWIDDVEVVER